MIDEGSSEALAFYGVINCGSESPFHHRTRHCRNISSGPRDALQGSLEGLTRRSKKIAIANFHTVKANGARADCCPSGELVRRPLVDTRRLKVDDEARAAVPARTRS